jgi:hypothetical protein
MGIAGEFQFHATEELAVPVISGLQPSSGPTGAGTRVTIGGDHLANASSVTFGATPAGIISNTNGEIVVQAPSSAAGAVDVHVTTVGGTSAASPGDIYTYAAVPARLATIATLGATHRVFAVGSAPTAADGITLAALRRPRGTTFTFTLDQTALMAIDVERKSIGRRVNGKCRRASRRLQKRKHCTLFTTIGVLHRAAHGGHNSLPFSGRIARTALRPATYRARFTAWTAFGPSRVQALTFRVVKR